MSKGGLLVAKEVFVPKLGQTMEEARLLKWLVADGTRVEEGQGILDVETDKAVFTVEANGTGTLHQGPFQEGEVVPVLTVVATIGKPGEKFVAGGQKTEEPDAAPSEAEAAETGGAAETASQPAAQPGGRDGKVFASPRARKLADAKGVDLAQVTPTGYGGERVAERDVSAYLTQQPKATPVAERMAAEAGVDLRTLTGTGPRGKITKEDVERAAAQERRRTEDEGQKKEEERRVLEPSPVLGLPSDILERVPLAGVRAIIADRMGKSVHTTARVTLFAEADATEFVNMRERLKARVEKEWGFAPGYNDLLAKITATALRQFPYMNARLAPDAIERLAHINMGMAVDTDRGLLVPVIRDTDRKNLRQFGAEFRELMERARNGRSLPDDLAGGTFTITNLGMYDIVAFTPIINMPEAAILGVGSITLQPVVREGQVVARQMTVLSLVFDHRVVDGAPAARFLQYIKNLIEEPYLWVAEQA
jgi:pyruvate dehydrogenase E2 component (dihydrolipoyllysine-residue acetyltransferase)